LAQRFSLRWFTPCTEVRLCGHATLATAATLFELGNTSRCLTFETLSGELLVSKKGGDAFRMDFPLNRLVQQDIQPLNELVKSVVDELPVHSVHYSPETRKVVIRLNDSVDAAGLRDMHPKFDRMLEAATAGLDVCGVSVTLVGGGEVDFFQRYFNPWVGVKEDPANGSSHTLLGPYWANVLSKNRLSSKALSARGGELVVDVDDGSGRVALEGSAKTVIAGSITIPDTKE